MNQTQALQTTNSHQAVEIPSDVSVAAMELAIGMGDFSRLTPADRLRYLSNVCITLRLNPTTLPIRIIKIDGKEVLYATAECSAQLAARDKVSIKILEEKMDHGCYFVRVAATTPDGRSHENVALLPMVYPAMTKEWRNGQSFSVPHPKAGKEFEGVDWANAVMKCHTKASRRATLRICSLGIPDESEVEELREARVTAVTDPPSRPLLSGTAEDNASKLNETIEAEPPIEAEIIPPKSEVPTTPPPPAPPLAEAPPIAEAPAPTPQAAQTSGGAPVSATAAPGLSDDIVRQLEGVFGANKHCVDFITARGKLKKGGDLKEIEPLYAQRIIENRNQFLVQVQGWVQGQKGTP